MDRSKLQEIRDYAESMAVMPYIVPSWSRAYTNLAEAVDTLDAMIARTEIRGIDVHTTSRRGK